MMPRAGRDVIGLLIFLPVLLFDLARLWRTGRLPEGLERERRWRLGRAARTAFPVIQKRKE